MLIRSARNLWRKMRVSILLVFFSVVIGTLGLENRIERCNEHQFRCEGGECIHVTKWCDTIKDCPNGYDEKYCSLKRNHTHPEVCPPGLYHCRIEGCFPKKGRCDGYNTCSDGYDEQNCPPRVTRAAPKRKLPISTTTSEEVLADDSPDYFYEDNVYTKEEENAEDWVLAQQKNYAWGGETERAIVALSLSEDGLKVNTEKEKLTVQSLHLRIALALAGQYHDISLSQRALFINALAASCGDPQNFYGRNLVADLRGSVNEVLRARREFMAPIVFLTLCLHNASMISDLEQINRDIEKLAISTRIGIKSLYLLTIVCMKNRSHHGNIVIFDVLGKRLVEELTKSDAENIYELALVTQALNAAKGNPDDWKREDKMKSILAHQSKEGDFRDMLATYYVMPLLSQKTLLSIGKHCEPLTYNDSTSSESLRKPRENIKVNYTINFGPQKISHTMFLSVIVKSTILDVMNSAQAKNTNYRFSLDEKKSKPVVYSIGGTPNDAERGLFWKLFLKNDRGDYELPITSIKDQLLFNGDGIKFSMEFL